MKTEPNDNPDMEPKTEKQINQHKGLYWDNEETVTMNCEWNNSIVSRLIFLILTVLLWIYKEKSYKIQNKTFWIKRHNSCKIILK